MERNESLFINRKQVNQVSYAPRSYVGKGGEGRCDAAGVGAAVANVCRLLFVGRPERWSLALELSDNAEEHDRRGDWRPEGPRTREEGRGGAERKLKGGRRAPSPQSSPDDVGLGRRTTDTGVDVCVGSRGVGRPFVYREVENLWRSPRQRCWRRP